ncbi:TonB family protein [candidate division KSB1 bacterium]|nr:TonB family protein [candidate division KSB1 bacterium]
MDKRRDLPVIRKHIFKIALFVSLLCHLLFLSCFDFFNQLTSLIPLSPEMETEPESEPLVFDLVETPQSAAVEEPPRDAQFLSDKNARAQDMNRDETLTAARPFSDGQTDYKLFAGDQQGQQGESEAAASLDKPASTEVITEEASPDEPRQEDSGTPVEMPQRQSYQPFNPELLRGSKNQRQPGDFSDDMNWDNQSSSSKNAGQISLSTYNWQWAPYIQYMKGRLRDHNYPPPAFYRMGAISGEVDLKFRLLKNGQVDNLELIGYNGHKALAETALNAVRASDPFRSLPDDFPDKYLDLTWKFIYFIQR